MLRARPWSSDRSSSSTAISGSTATSASTSRVPAYRISGSGVSAPVREGQKQSQKQNGAGFRPRDPAPAAAPVRNGSLSDRISDRTSVRSSDRTPGRPSDRTPVKDPVSDPGPRHEEPDLHLPSDHPVIVFEEDDTIVEPADPGSTRSFSPVRATRSSRRALQRSSRPPSRVPVVLGVLLVVVVIAVGVAVAVGVGSHHHNASPPSSVTTRTTTSQAKSHPKTTADSTVTSTTAPRVVSPVAATVTTQAAGYAAPDSSYTVTLTSSGACWVYAKLASTGAVVWTGILESGQSQALDVTGQLDVELGHANTLSATLNGVPVEYPPHYQAVFTMSFVPSGF